MRLVQAKIFFFSFVLLKSYFRLIRSGPCEHFTVDICPLPDRDIIDSFPQVNVKNCQDICIIFANCDTFQFNSETSNCTLLTADYRQRCEFNAGPMVN